MDENLFNVPIYLPYIKSAKLFLAGGQPVDVPFLEKKTLQGCFPSGFRTPALSEAIRAGAVEYASTSGSSGERLPLIRSPSWWHEEYRAAYTTIPALEEFNYEGCKIAVLTSVLCSGNSCGMVDADFSARKERNTLYLNTINNPHDWVLSDIQRIVGELNEFQPDILQVNPSYLAIFIKKLLQFNVVKPVHTPKKILSSYEFLTRELRKCIESFFDINVLDMLGSSELGVLFLQCENKTYTRCPRASFIELYPIYPEENIYELVVTSWRNSLMPLLRYRTGDLVEIKDQVVAAQTWREHESFCIDKLHGRRSDSAIFSTEKKVITALKLDNAIALCEWQPEFYCLEKSNKFAILRYSQAPHGDMLAAHLNFKSLTKLLAPTKLIFQKVHIVQPTQSGKFMTLRSICDD